MRNHTGSNKASCRGKGVLFFLISILSLGVLATSVAFSRPSPAPVSAEGTQMVFENEDEDPLDSETMAVKARSSTLTDTSQLLKVSFSTSVALYNNGRYANVFIAVNDAEFNLEKAAKDAKSDMADFEAGKIPTYEPKVYDVRVFQIAYTIAGGNKTPHDIVIPEYINCRTAKVKDPATGATINTYQFRYHVVAIDKGVCFSNKKTRDIDWTGIDSITIPASVVTVAEGAFEGAQAAGAKLYFQQTKEEFEENYSFESDWNDFDEPEKNIFYDATFDPEKKYDELNELYISPNNSSSASIGKDVNYILGCHVTDETYAAYRKPLVMEYRFKSDAATERRYLEVAKKNLKNYFDGVGNMLGATTIEFTIDVDLPGDTEVEPSSIIFHNIFDATKVEGGPGWLPNIAAASHKSVPAIGYESSVRLGSFFNSTSLDSIAIYGDYISFNINIDANLGAFAVYKEKSYNANKEDIENGTLQIRYQFVSLPQTKYRLTFRDGTTSTIYINTPISAATIRSNHIFTFMMQKAEFGHDFSEKDIASFTLADFSLHLDLYDQKKNSIKNNSKYTAQFASLVFVLPADGPGKVTNIPSIIVTAYILFVAIYAAAMLGYYFYAKRAFRNDEFRRMNPKKYFLKALKNFIGSSIVFLAILFIISRWGLLNNTVVVFNPVDPWVITFTIAGLIYLGFTIKNLVVSIKLSRERKRKLRLKLDEDVVEDGTN